MLTAAFRRKYAYADETFYLNTILAFLINFALLRIYMHSQPEENHGNDAELDAHAIDINLWRSVMFDLSQAVVTSGLFAYGVAVKFVCKYGQYKDGAYYMTVSFLPK